MSHLMELSLCVGERQSFMEVFTGIHDYNYFCVCVCVCVCVCCMVCNMWCV
jgi:hypothetical protein